MHECSNRGSCDRKRDTQGAEMKTPKAFGERRRLPNWVPGLQVVKERKLRVKRSSFLSTVEIISLF